MLHDAQRLFLPAPCPMWLASPCTGTIPAALASLPLLGVLRLGGNKLTGSLSAFAAALNDPAAVAAAKAQAPAGSSSSSTKPGLSRLFDLNVTSNQLTGPVPDQLAYLGVFNPNITILVPGSDGAAAIAPRVVDLSGNALAGDWPRWLLKAVSCREGRAGEPAGKALHSRAQLQQAWQHGRG